PRRRRCSQIVQSPRLLKKRFCCPEHAERRYTDRGHQRNNKKYNCPAERFCHVSADDGREDARKICETVLHRRERSGVSRCKVEGITAVTRGCCSDEESVERQQEDGQEP